MLLGCHFIVFTYDSGDIADWRTCLVFKLVGMVSENVELNFSLANQHVPHQDYYAVIALSRANQKIA
jgi:hypothetical protein